MHIQTRPVLVDRRRFLRSGGVALALPMLEAMTPRMVRAREKSPTTPRRMLAICNNLGLLPDKFFPKSDEPLADSPYLNELVRSRQRVTVLSGISHPGVDGSHASDVSFLTAAPHPGSGGFKNSISLDQFIASKIGPVTRFPSLTLGVNARPGRRSLSFTEAGVLIPCEDRASEIYKKLFLDGTPAQIEEQVRRLGLGQSIMDTLVDESRDLTRRLGSADRERLDQYMTALRDVEKRMAAGAEWESRPKPSPLIAPPDDPADRADYMEKTRLMYLMAKLAFETDATRCITLLLDSNNSPTINVEGSRISDGYHNLSHHGRNKEKLAQLEAIDRRHMQLFDGLLDDLATTPDGGKSLLDHTMVFYGSNLGDANRHTTSNLPLMIAGGQFSHGRHLRHDPVRNTPLCNAFVSIMQEMDLEVERFASSTGTLSDLYS